MSKTQRNKGANAEREVVHILEENGFPARRGQVFNGEPDIICEGLPFHIEVKRQETLKINDWWRQSKAASGENEIPTVVFRRSREDWKILMSLSDLLAILTEANWRQNDELNKVQEV